MTRLDKLMPIGTWVRPAGLSGSAPRATPATGHRTPGNIPAAPILQRWGRVVTRP